MKAMVSIWLQKTSSEHLKVAKYSLEYFFEENGLQMKNDIIWNWYSKQTFISNTENGSIYKSIKINWCLLH